MSKKEWYTIDLSDDEEIKTPTTTAPSNTSPPLARSPPLSKSPPLTRSSMMSAPSLTTTHTESQRSSGSKKNSLSQTKTISTGKNLINGSFRTVSQPVIPVKRYTVDDLPASFAGLSGLYSQSLEHRSTQDTDINTEEAKMRLMDCTKRGESVIVEVLLSKGVDPNFLHPSGKTPFIVAIEKKNLHLVSIFLDSRNLNINQTDETGQTPLIVLAKLNMGQSLLEGNMIQILRRLILERQDVDINAQDSGGNTALHYATVNSQISFVEALLLKGASVNITNIQGITPVHSAAIQNNINLSLMFLRHGADIQLTTPEGKSLKDLATDLQLKKSLSGFRTSLTNPLSISFLDLSFVGKKLGTLGITMCPGRIQKKIWARDFQLDLEYLIQANCEVLVSVITRKELNEMGLSDFIENVGKKGIESLQISISNNWLPNSFEEFQAMTINVLKRLLKGKRVVLHCDSGKSRSVFFGAAVLLQLGANLEKAKQLFRSINEELSNPAHILYLNKIKYKNLEEYIQEMQQPLKVEAVDQSDSETEPEHLQTLNDTTFSV